MKEVAAEAGVSAATVSRALNGDLRISPPTRERVMAVAIRMGYVKSFSAAGLASGRNRNVGVLVPTVNRWYFSAILEGITAALLVNGYDLTLYNAAGGLHHNALLDDFIPRQRVDGTIVVGSDLSSNEVSKLQTGNRPVVLVGGSLRGVREHRVDEAERQVDEAAAGAATAHLLGLGHRRIAFIGGPAAGCPLFAPCRLRQQGFRTALNEANVMLRDKWNVHTEPTVAGGYAAGMALLAEARGVRPTALVGATDEAALGLMLAAKDLYLTVPGDVSIIGIDGSPLGVTFGLTTVDLFPEEQGRQTVHRILEELGSPPEDCSQPARTVEAKLLIRLSTALPFH